ncbi:Dyp-type peroxidase [Propionivibrio sp.]|uniref:Dyp-type peroxidase n=1 Tax=Propionivibrio sp. TaxID=2212460 RepID=UPI0025F4C95F|nr:Dyp-type peroxidase [Propionivibrio sp.]MBK7355393.1 Dyp-type peroxidase [Propionivibrio sp.]MBK8399787.1 Dyp-type peroxidase [Propionivibrio sp.]MBK8743315.1 Dyp-type peroxidase [Propionivibrio sp.]MBK8894661.1 Dyp-type peroxidase [Propionivibrio sp.]
MNTLQRGILLPVPNQARYLSFAIGDPARVRDGLRVLGELAEDDYTVIGIGQTLVSLMKTSIPGLKNFPTITAPGLVIERAPEVLWVWLRGDERGEIVLRSQRLVRVLAPAFRLKESWDAFKYAEGRDLSGYVDGTENPTGDEAIHTAMIGAEHPTIRGSSFVATQRWRHDFERLESMTEGEKDSSIGRRLVDNEEIDDAPETAHVKRTAQESFTPEAFVLRRSMPWSDASDAGLMFVAFAASFYAFEAQLQRMAGAEDGVVDALFKFTQPVSGAYFWCPAVKDGKLDLSPLAC